MLSLETGIGGARTELSRVRDALQSERAAIKSRFEREPNPARLLRESRVEAHP